MTKTTSSLLLAGVLSATLMTSVNVRAEEAAAAPASPHTITTNVGIFNDYLFRGTSYGKERGAIQGGLDYSHSSGLYAGVWASSVQADSPLAGNTTEIDLYGGYVYPINADLSLNVGFLQFYYPNHKTYQGLTSQNTTELNAALTYKYFTLKHSYTVSDYFGVVGSDGTGYTEFNVAYPVAQLAGLNLAAHVGHLNYENWSAGSYTDYNVGVSKDFSIAGSTGYNVGAVYSYSDADTAAYPKAADGFNWVGSHGLVWVKRTF
jgi:uncharacterized protein (TIGR02001 family)